MNVLLTTSAPPTQTPFSTNEKRPPIGVGFLISVLRDAGHNVYFIDNYLQPNNFLETDYLQHHHIDFVGIYTNTICYRDSLRMFYRLEELRQMGAWRGKIIAGGPHASVSPETIPSFVDHIVIGEGEYAIRDVVAGKVTERIVQYPSIENLDELPMPAWDYFAEMPYDWGGNWLPDAPVFTMNTSRGCPFDCTFCSVGSIWGRRYTYFSAERVVADIEYVVKHHGAKGIYFREDNFTLNKKRLYEFCNLMIERGINIPWVCETRASSLDRETVELMARAGAKGAYIGVESGSQRLLDFMHKAIKLEDVRRAFQLCQEFGINTAASIIVGVPTETQWDLQMTMELLKDIKPTVTWFNVFVGIPKSNLYRYVLDNKLYEYIDDRGLVYLKGHNERVRAWYGQTWDAEIPIKIQNHTIIAPKVSVIMSVYNGENYLLEAIKSIQSQTFNNLEFLIVNDASTDNTAQILQQIDDPRIRVFTNQQNLGLTRSLNKVLKHCRGDFIARMDADDVSHPFRLEKQVSFLESHPTYALVGSSYYVINETGKTISHVNVLTESSQIKAGLKIQNWFGHGSVMMRKSACNEVGGYDEDFKYSQDYDLWLRLSELYDVANIKEPLYFWRSTEKAISCDKAQEQQLFAELAKKNALTRAQSRIENSGTQREQGFPKVSVIVPTYNRPDMLPDTLRSILAQTYPNIEIVVVNDAGQDVEQLVRTVAPNAVYIRHECNKGLAGARNTGIRRATGKYIAYLDDDDIFYPEHVETLVTFLEGNDYRVAYSDAHRSHQVKECGRYIVRKRDLPYSVDFDYDQILIDNFVPVLCLMHDKGCIEESGYFDENLRRHEDWDLWIRMSRNLRFAHISKVTCEYSYRVDGSGMTTGTFPMFLATKNTIYAKYRNLASLDIQRRQRADTWEFMCHLYTFLEGRIEPLIPLFTTGRHSEGEKKLSELAATGATPAQLQSALADQLAMTHLKSGFVAEAIAQFERAVASDDMNPIASHNLAAVYRKTGRSSDAASVYRRILERNESEIPSLIALAELAAEQGDFAESRKRYEKVLEYEQDNKIAADTLADLPSPTPETAAGNRLKVAVYSIDHPEHACAHIRTIAPIASLENSIELKWGVDLKSEPASVNTTLPPWADLIIVQRFFPMANTAPLLERILALGKPVIYETDDLLVEVPATNPHQRGADAAKPYIFDLIAKAAAVTVSTEEMKRAFASHHRQIHVLPNLLDDRLWTVPLPVKPAGAPVVIGYAGTPDHKADLRLLEEVLERIAAKYGSRVAFRFMGCDTERIKGLPGFSSIRFEPGYANYARTIQKAGIDIGLVPLEDNHFNRCKSNIKWLEYSACGIAGIYADLPPYRSCVKEGETGLLVAGYDADAWVAAIENLIDNPDRRHAMVLAARTEVLANYTLKSRGHLFLDTWRRIAGRTDTTAKEQQMRISSQPFTPVAAATGSDAPKVSIIIPLYNKVEYTKQCLEALVLNIDQSLGYEVILVDNASSDGTADYLRTLSGDVTVVTNLRNLGFAKACNQGGRIARGRYLVFLNNDTIPHPGWLDGLIKGAERDGADIVGAKLLYPNGRAQHAGVAFNEQSIGYHIFNGFTADAPAVNRKRFMQCVTAACILVKGELFAELGGFDEGYVNGFEDVDFCLRAGERGRRILYNPDSVLIHFEETSEGRKAHDEPNIRRFLARWQGKVRCDDQEFYRAEGFRTEKMPDGRLRIFPAPTAPETPRTALPVQPAPAPAVPSCSAVPPTADRETALALKREGRFVEALDVLSKILTRGDRSVLVDAGDCLAALEKHDDALALYGEALAAAPADARAHVGIGVVKLLTGRLAEASAAFTRALEGEPANPKALCGLGLVRGAQERPGEAFDLFRRALDADPENLTALHELVKLAYALERFTEAAGHLETYLLYHPGDTDMLFSRAGILYMANEPAKAREAVERLLALSPGYEGAGELLTKLGDSKAGTGDRGPGIGKREVQPVTEAWQLKEAGKFEEALAAFSRMAEEGDRSVLADRGDCLANLGRLDEAAASYQEALQENEADPKAIVGLGVVSLLQGKQVKAVTWFNRALKADPANTRALCGLGMVRNMQGKEGEAFDCFRRALAADPENLTALHELVKLSYATGRFDEALPLLDSYLMHHPADLDMLYTLAGIQHKAGSNAEALESIEKVLLFSPDYEGGKELFERIRESAAA